MVSLFSPWFQRRKKKQKSTLKNYNFEISVGIFTLTLCISCLNILLLGPKKWLWCLKCEFGRTIPIRFVLQKFEEKRRFWPGIANFHSLFTTNTYKQVLWSNLVRFDWFLEKSGPILEQKSQNVHIYMIIGKISINQPIWL